MADKDQKIAIVDVKYFDNLSNILGGISLPVSHNAESNLIASVIKSLQTTKQNALKQDYNNPKAPEGTETPKEEKKPSEVKKNGAEDGVKSDSQKAVEHQKKKQAKK